MSELLDKQMKFTRMAAELILWAYEQGYTITLGHAFRCEKCHTGRKNSLHKSRLAIDLNLFKDGRWLVHTDDFIALGEKWESMGGTWGGRFNDGNHFSLAHDGRK